MDIVNKDQNTNKKPNLDQAVKSWVKLCVFHTYHNHKNQNKKTNNDYKKQ